MSFSAVTFPAKASHSVAIRGVQLTEHFASAKNKRCFQNLMTSLFSVDRGFADVRDGDLYRSWIQSPLANREIILCDVWAISISGHFARIRKFTLNESWRMKQLEEQWDREKYFRTRQKKDQLTRHSISWKKAKEIFQFISLPWRHPRLERKPCVIMNRTDRRAWPITAVR